MLTYQYIIHGVYHTYEEGVFSETFTLTTHPADTDYDSVSRALHEGLQKVYRQPGYFSSVSKIDCKHYWE